MLNNTTYTLPELQGVFSKENRTSLFQQLAQNQDSVSSLSKSFESLADADRRNFLSTLGVQLYEEQSGIAWSAMMGMQTGESQNRAINLALEKAGITGQNGFNNYLNSLAGQAAASAQPTPQQQLNNAFNNSLTGGGSGGYGGGTGKTVQSVITQAYGVNKQASQYASIVEKQLASLLGLEQQQSADLLGITANLLKGNQTGAQTGLESTDVSQELDARQDKLKKIKSSSKGIEGTKTGAGLLASQALLARPTLLGQ